MITITYDEAVIAAKNAKKMKQECTLVSIADKIGYAIGKQANTCDYSEISPIKSSKYDGKWNGGTIVIAPGDICICILSKENKNIGHEVILACKRYLVEQGLAVYEDGNDLMLIDDNVHMKVGSYAYTQPSGEMVETVVHISIGMELDLIEKVCTKKGKRVSKGLSYYGVNTSDIIVCISPIFDNN